MYMAQRLRAFKGAQRFYTKKAIFQSPLPDPFDLEFRGVIVEKTKQYEYYLPLHRIIHSDWSYHFINYYINKRKITLEILG